MIICAFSASRYSKKESAAGDSFFDDNQIKFQVVSIEAWEQDEIDPKVMTALLEENHLPETPAFYLELLARHQVSEQLNESQQVDRIMAKRLAAFLDEGLAE